MSQHSIICHNVLQNNSYRRAFKYHYAASTFSAHPTWLISVPYFVSTRQFSSIPNAMNKRDTLHEREGAKMDNSIKIWSATYSYVTRNLLEAKQLTSLTVLKWFRKAWHSFQIKRMSVWKRKHCKPYPSPLTCVGDEE